MVKMGYVYTRVHTYTKVARGQDRVEVMSMVDLVLVKDILHYVQYVRSVKGMA